VYKLLIVDDEAIEREAIKFIIEKSTLTFEAIEEAENGQEAVGTAAIFKPDIIMMDIKMPGMNGIESAKVIKKIKADTKIIFLTAFNEFEYAREGIKIGVEEYIVKPAVNERIIEALRKIIDGLEKEKQEKETINETENKLEKIAKHLEREFFFSIITGEMQKEQIEECMRFMGIHVTNGFGVVIQPCYELLADQSTFRRQMVQNRIQHHLEKMMRKAYRNWYIILRNEDIYMMVFEKEEITLAINRKQLPEQLLQMEKILFGTQGKSLQFGLGKSKHKLENLWQSFSEAKHLCREKLKKDTKKLENISLEKLIQYIIEGNQVEINQEIEEIYQKVIERTKDVHGIKVKIYEHIIMMNHAIEERLPNPLEGDRHLFEAIMATETISQGKRLFKNYVHTLMDLIGKERLSGTTIVMNQLITHLKENYSQSITLEQLAELSGFSSCHLSKVFKKHTGMNYSDYLAYLRVDMGRKMLTQSKKSVKEISQMVGYSDPNYFARVFKKYEKITPTEYRIKYGHREN